MLVLGGVGPVACRPVVLGGAPEIDKKEYDFEQAVARIRSDPPRGGANAQIAQGCASELKVHPSTIYRWVAARYAGMSSARAALQGWLQAQEGAFREEAHTLHGQERSYKAFSALSTSGERGRARWIR